VLDDLDGRIDAVVDAGPTLHGVESTVLDPGQNPMVIYRPGAVTAVQIRDTAGAVQVFSGEGTLVDKPQAALPSPGVGLRHYAPQARLVLVEGTLEGMAARLDVVARESSGERVGVMLPAEVSWNGSGPTLFPWGRWSAPEELAHSLYAGLRELDAKGCAVILCPLPPEGGIGAALRDRLRKAAHEGRGIRD
jgi:L-threonylcarbamoyladenylate synthase